MVLTRWREKWRQRRLELAMQQIQNPTELLSDDGMVNPTPMEVRQLRERLGAVGRMSRATSKTEWRGD